MEDLSLSLQLFQINNKIIQKENAIFKKKKQQKEGTPKLVITDQLEKSLNTLRGGFFDGRKESKQEEKAPPSPPGTCTMPTQKQAVVMTGQGDIFCSFLG